MVTNTTQAPRPAAVDLTREREYWAEAPRVLAILADLRVTRNERDAALATLASIGLAEAAAAADPVTVPDLPPFLAARVNGAAR